MSEIQVRDLDEAITHLRSHEVRIAELERRLRATEKVDDTFDLTPLWKRLLFRLDGWPGHRIVSRPRWRPWHRWWVS